MGLGKILNWVLGLHFLHDLIYSGHAQTYAMPVLPGK